MKTKDVKIGLKYLYKGSIVTVDQRIQGIETTNRNMQSGALFTGMHRQRKSFLLSNGEKVYSNQIELL